MQEEWIRIQSRKLGDFSLNKRTGEVVLAEPSLHPTTSELMAGYAPAATSSEQETEATPTLSQRKSGKKAKKQRRKKASDGSPGVNHSVIGEGEDLVSPPPPLLRRRTPRVDESSASVDGQNTRPNDVSTATPSEAITQPIPEDVQMSQVSTTLDNAEDPANEVGKNDVPATSNDVQKLVLPRISEDMHEMGASQVPSTLDNVDGLATHPKKDSSATDDPV